MFVAAYKHIHALNNQTIKFFGNFIESSLSFAFVLMIQILVFSFVPGINIWKTNEYEDLTTFKLLFDDWPGSLEWSGPCLPCLGPESERVSKVLRASILELPVEDHSFTSTILLLAMVSLNHIFVPSIIYGAPRSRKAEFMNQRIIKFDRYPFEAHKAGACVCPFVRSLLGSVGWLYWFACSTIVLLWWLLKSRTACSHSATRWTKPI